MASTFIIVFIYALCGVIYSPSIDSLVAFLFIIFSTIPLLLVSSITYRMPVMKHPTPSATVIAIILLLGILNLTLVANGLGFSSFDILNIEEFIQISSKSTARRYSEETSSGNSLLLALSFFLIYRMGAAIKDCRFYFQVASFLPIIFYVLLTTEKWPLILSIAFYITGIFAAESESEALNLVSKLNLFIVPFSILLGVVGLYLRGFDGDLIDSFSALLHYVLAPFSALGYWLLNHSTDSCCEYGRFTFIGIANQMGLTARNAGVFSDNFSVYNIETNIYTSWRYLAQDFSIIGPLFISLTIAGISIFFKIVRCEIGITLLKYS